jgi:hypothetical protein
MKMQNTLKKVDIYSTERVGSQKISGDFATVAPAINETILL